MSPGSTGRKAFRAALVILPLGALANIAYALLATDPGALAAVDAFPWRYLLLALGLALVPWATNSLRLLIWARLLGYRFGFGQALHATLAAELGAAVSPTAVGGDLFKWGVLVRSGVTPGESASLIALPSIEDALFFAVALPSAAFATSAWDHPVLWRAAGQLQGRAVEVTAGVAIVALASWLTVRGLLEGWGGRWARRRTRRAVARLRRRVRRARRQARTAFALIARRGKARFALSMALTAVQWSARYSVIIALLMFLGVSVDPLLFWLLQWVVFTFMSFMPTPGASGGAEAAFLLVYGAFIPAGAIGVATAGWRFLTFYLQAGLAAVVFTGLRMLGPAARRDQRPGRTRFVGVASSGSSGQ